MTDPARFTLTYRDPATVARMWRAIVDNPTEPYRPHDQTERRILGELLDHGIARALHTRAGRLDAHRITRLGWAWWQGRTLLPVVTSTDGVAWSWHTPAAGEHHVDPDTGRATFHPADPEQLVEVSTATATDDDALIAAELARLEERRRTFGKRTPPAPHGTCEECDEPNIATLGDGTPWCGECDGDVSPE